MKRIRTFFHLLALAGTAILLPVQIQAQSTLSQNQDGFSGAQADGFMDSGPDKDSTVIERVVPTDYNQWTIDHVSGLTQMVRPDTLHHSFHNVHLTEGMQGSYSHLGNMGSPRLSRLYFERNQVQDFMFLSPFDFWVKDPMDFRYTDLKTPHVSIDYYKGGDKQTGEEHIKGYFAANFGKRVGIGFDLDYLLGRGRYDNQSTSFFDARAYTYYRGDFYNMHVSLNSDEMKLAENGGIQDRRYITNPEAMAEGRKSYDPEDIPFRLYDNWNNMTRKQLLFNQSIPLAIRHITTRAIADTDTLANDETASAPVALASAYSVQEIAQNEPEPVPSTTKTVNDTVKVTLGRLAHSLELGNLGRRYISYAQPSGFYEQQFLKADSIDRYSNFYVDNTLSLSLSEGATPWAIASLTGFINHEYRSFEMPDLDQDSSEFMHRYTQSDLKAGAKLEKAKGENLTFMGLAETWVAGYKAGDLNVQGQVSLTDSLLGNKARIDASIGFSSLTPAFFLNRYHSTFAWWDNNFDREIKTKAGVAAYLEKTGTTLSVNFENIGSYVYLENTGSAYTNADNVQQPSYLISAKQNNGSIQVISASLDQKFKWGPLHLDGRVTWQNSSNSRVLPLPQLNAFADVYLKFIYAKRLNMEIGANATYFTRYDAPAYCPAVGMYHLQSQQLIEQVGGYPLMTAYVNCSLRGVRFYILYYHVNDGLLNTTDSFIVPGYPANPGMMKFGLSWTFFD